jgi:ABC-2 type transport system permease protein
MPAGRLQGTVADSVRPLSVDAESRLFFRLRTQIAWATLRTMFATAKLRLSLVVLLSLMFWTAVFGLFLEAFHFLTALHAEVIPLLFNAFFTSLTLMLLFSAGILVFTGLYCSAEARLLLTLPARAEAIFAHKFQEALWFSCWGFVLLGSPMLVAYGSARGADWPYYAVILPFMVSFAVIPATVGGILCLLLVLWMPRLRAHALPLAVAAGCLLAIGLGWWMTSRPRTDGLSTTWFQQTLSRLSIAEHKLLPSWWLSSGLLEAARSGRAADERGGSMLESLSFLGLLISNAMVVQLAAAWIARRSYRVGYSQIVAEAPTRRRRPLGWFDRTLSGSGSSAGHPLRLLILKDLRIFRRDISQWSQFVIFFGLLGLYFFNLRSFNYNTAYASVIGYLNLAVVGLILSTFTTRFVFPMISLEGRRFWVLGLLPVDRDQIVWSKFIFSFVGGLVPCVGLVFLSDVMLGLPWHLVAQHQLCCLMLCMGLSGIAVGLGARMPDLREPSPAKISSGFGGTLNLVVSALFILATVLVAAIPIQVSALASALGVPRLASSGFLAWAGGPQGLAASYVVIVGLGIAATLVPLRLGFEAFRRLEP